MTTHWALIPARGGSRGIPLKNIAPLAGRPLIDYGIAAAKASPSLGRIVCSTDSEPIAARARQLGVDVVRRPDHLATDEARVDDVARDFLASLQPGSRPDVIVLVQPSSPFLLPEHISALLTFSRTGRRQRRFTTWCASRISATRGTSERLDPTAECRSCSRPSGT